jgi:hypothetical protein
MAIPTVKVLIALIELKFALLILHKSAMALFIEFIPRSALSLAMNF